MLTDLGQIDKGIVYGRKWLDASPDDLGLKAHLGVLYAKQDNLDAATPLLRDSLQDSIPRQLVHQILGNIAVLNGDSPAALLHFRQEQQLFFQPGLYDRTARVLFSMQRWEESVDDFAVYLEAYPGDHVARRQMAQAVYNTYDFEAAEALLTPVLAALPDDPDVLLLHANILAKIGDPAEAQAAASRANQLHRERLQQAGVVILPEPAPDTP
jgi:tetratricopeptide (TPR) repeat protein